MGKEVVTTNCIKARTGNKDTLGSMGAKWTQRGHLCGLCHLLQRAIPGPWAKQFYVIHAHSATWPCTAVACVCADSWGVAGELGLSGLKPARVQSLNENMETPKQKEL